MTFQACDFLRKTKINDKQCAGIVYHEIERIAIILYYTGFVQLFADLDNAILVGLAQGRDGQGSGYIRFITSTIVSFIRLHDNVFLRGVDGGTRATLHEPRRAHKSALDIAFDDFREHFDGVLCA